MAGGRDNIDAASKPSNEIVEMSDDRVPRKHRSRKRRARAIFSRGWKDAIVLPKIGGAQLCADFGEL
jgi:hypothetical protein